MFFNIIWPTQAAQPSPLTLERPRWSATSPSSVPAQRQGQRRPGWGCLAIAGSHPLPSDPAKTRAIRTIPLDSGGWEPGLEKTPPRLLLPSGLTLGRPCRPGGQHLLSRQCQLSARAREDPRVPLTNSLVIRPREDQEGCRPTPVHQGGQRASVYRLREHRLSLRDLVII